MTDLPTVNQSAASWRGLIQQTTTRYGGEPGGAPPWPIVEGMVDLESGGNSAIVDQYSGAVGLGQITQTGYEYGVYQQANPGKTIDLRDPGTNLAIMVYGLAKRHEQGGYYGNWFGAAEGYLGAATPSGPTGSVDAYGTGAAAYSGRIKTYLQSVFGLSAPQIAAMGASGTIPPTLPAASPGSAPAGASPATAGVANLAGRGGVYLLGLALVVLGLWLR